MTGAQEPENVSTTTQRIAESARTHPQLRSFLDQRVRDGVLFIPWRSKSSRTRSRMR